jgi:hypothetical protein
MNGTTLHTRHTTPPPLDRRRLALLRVEEREAWQALMTAGAQLVSATRAPHYAPVARRLYAEALLTWRAARHALDLALVPVPSRQPGGRTRRAAPGPRHPERRPHAKRAWWRPARG